MAELTRRGWDEILEEVIRRAGGLNFSGFSARAQHLISAAYYDICSLYRHVELETTQNQTTALYQVVFPLESDVHHVHFVFEYTTPQPFATTDTASPTRFLDRKEFSELAANFDQLNTSGARPQSYAIYGDSTLESKALYFNCLCDTPRTYKVLYQFMPDRPDFESTDPPEIGPHWDEHLIELSLAKIGAAFADQQLAAINSALFRDFVSQSGQMLISGTTGSSTPEDVVVHRMPTGKVP